MDLAVPAAAPRVKDGAAAFRDLIDPQLARSYRLAAVILGDPGDQRTVPATAFDVPAVHARPGCVA